jgi:hypothetical protein
MLLVLTKSKILIMKKIIMLTALTLCIGMAGFANGTKHTIKKKDHPVTQHNMKAKAFIDCYANFSTYDTCCDGEVVLTGTGAVVYDCASGAPTSVIYVTTTGCWYLCG